MPISILAPAYNEEATASATVRSLLQLTYPNFEVIVINDGSRDGTLETLKKDFSLFLFPESLRRDLPTKPVRGVYRSKLHPNLRVVDKENGGKADALNAGLNLAGHPLFCCIDADSILPRNSLQQVMKPFLEDPKTVAAGGTIRIANGCEIREGNLVRTGLPRNPLAVFQIVEYLRAFLFGRMGWSPMNALLVISGAFGLFRREAVVSVGGYRHDTVGEDMELVVRLHRQFRLRGVPYRIHFVPDPICWTEAPESMAILKKQRLRWQHGLGQALAMNARLLFHPRGGMAGWVAFPYMVFVEWLGPLVEVSGYLFLLFAFAAGFVSPGPALAFFVAALGTGMLLSVSSLLLEAISFRVYSKTSHLFTLFLAAFFENFGYRQWNSWWRLLGLLRWAFRAKASWGDMKRKGLSLTTDI